MAQCMAELPFRIAAAVTRHILLLSARRIRQISAPIAGRQVAASLPGRACYTASVKADRLAGWGVRSGPAKACRAGGCGLPVLSLTVLLAIGAAPFSARAGETNLADVITAKVIRVDYGDTLTVVDTSDELHRIRLLGAAAPGMKQPFGDKAQEALSGKVLGKTVTIRMAERDRAGCSLGDVYLEDRWINQEMVREGWAWYYDAYTQNPELAAAHRRARNGMVGLWQDKHPVPPWEFSEASSAKSASAAAGGTAAPKMEW